MLSTITENEELSRSSRSFLHEFHQHLISLTILDEFCDHVWHGNFPVSHRGWRVPIICRIESHWKHFNLFLIFPLNCKKSGAHEPMKYFSQTILSLRCR